MNTAIEIIDAVVLTLAKRPISGCTEGELLYMAQQRLPQPLGLHELRAVAALLRITGEIMVQGTNGTQKEVYYPLPK